MTSDNLSHIYFPFKIEDKTSKVKIKKDIIKRKELVSHLPCKNIFNFNFLPND